jgi:hypothetical protein
VIHSEAQLLLPAGAVLDDLAPDERAGYEAHRATCAACRRVELELDHVLADLALAVPERVPPPDLMSGIRRSLAAEAATAGGPGITVGRPRPAVVPLRRPSRGPVLASLALAAGLGVVALGLGVRTVALEQDLGEATAQVDALESTLASQGEAMTVALNPGHRTVALHGDALAPDAEAAVVFVPGDAAAWIVAHNLPATPDGHGYQVWYADQAGIHPLQTVAHDGTGALVVPIGVDLARSSAVMITLETDSGAQGEPGPQVVFGEL